MKFQISGNYPLLIFLVYIRSCATTNTLLKNRNVDKYFFEEQKPMPSPHTRNNVTASESQLVTIYDQVEPRKPLNRGPRMPGKSSQTFNIEHINENKYSKVRRNRQRRKKHAPYAHNENIKFVHTFEEIHTHIDEKDKHLRPLNEQELSQSSDRYESHQLPRYLDAEAGASHHKEKEKHAEHENHEEHEEHGEHEEHEKHEEYEKHEKIKIKHHHHHHHHNHVKEIIKKVPEPYPVEKIVHVPVEKIIEKVVHVPKPYAVEKIIEKIVRVPVEKIVHVPKPYPVEKIVEKKVPYAVEKIVEKKVPYPVEKVVHVPVEKIIEKIVHVTKIVEKKIPYPVEKIVEKIVHVPRVVEKIVHIPVEKIVEKVVHVPKPYPVEKIVNKIVHVPKPYPVIKPIPVPYEVKVPYKVEVEKKVPVYIHHHEMQKHEHQQQHQQQPHQHYEEEKEHSFAESESNQHEHIETPYYQNSKSHYDSDGLSSNESVALEIQRPQRHYQSQGSQSYSNSANTAAIRNELLRQQLQNFGYQKHTYDAEPAASESKPFTVAVAPQDTVSTADKSGATHLPHSMSPIAIDLQPQASTNGFLTRVPSIALPLQVYQLQPMPFHHGLSLA